MHGILQFFFIFFSSKTSIFFSSLLYFFFPSSKIQVLLIILQLIITYHFFSYFANFSSPIFILNTRSASKHKTLHHFMFLLWSRCIFAVHNEQYVFSHPSLLHPGHVSCLIGATLLHYLPCTIVPHRLTHCNYASRRYLFRARDFIPFHLSSLISFFFFLISFVSSDFFAHFVLLVRDWSIVLNFATWSKFQGPYALRFSFAGGYIYIERKIKYNY